MKDDINCDNEIYFFLLYCGLPNIDTEIGHKYAVKFKSERLTLASLRKNLGNKDRREDISKRLDIKLGDLYEIQDAVEGEQFSAFQAAVEKLKMREPPTDGVLPTKTSWWARMFEKDVMGTLMERYNAKYPEDKAKAKEKALHEYKVATEIKLMQAKLKPLWDESVNANTKNSIPIRVTLSSPLGGGVNAFSQWWLGLFASGCGFLHVGLQIGKIRLDWYSDGIVHARNLESKNYLETPIVVFSPVGNTELPKNDSNLKKICEVVVDWTKNQKYSSSKDSLAFVTSILTKLDMTMPADIMSTKTALGRYLIHLKKSGSNLRVLIRSNETITFNSHEVLDTWHRDNDGSLSTDEVTLLKAFHRSFQFEEAAKKQEQIDAQTTTTCHMGLVTFYSKEISLRVVYSNKEQEVVVLMGDKYEEFFKKIQEKIKCDDIKNVALEIIPRAGPNVPIDKTKTVGQNGLKNKQSVIQVVKV